MSSPENVIVKEKGPFLDQPAWVEDYYHNLLCATGAYHYHFVHSSISDYMRDRHNFPPEASGLVVNISNPHQPMRGTISGSFLNDEQYSRFIAFIQAGYKVEEKNNFVLIDDIVAEIINNELFTSDRCSLDAVYEIICEAVYAARPHSGPDDVWTDAIVDALFDKGFVDPKHRWDTLREFFTTEFSRHVYGYRPKPEPSSSFVDSLAAKLEQHGYSQASENRVSLQEVVKQAVADGPHSHWLAEPPRPSRMSEAKVQKAAQKMREKLVDHGWISQEDYDDPGLRDLMEGVFA